MESEPSESDGGASDGVSARETHSAFVPSLLLFGAALFVRALPWQTVFLGDRVFFFGNDAYYHMRRVLLGLSRLTAPMDFDPYLNFPNGGQAIWPVFFDRALALLALPFHAGGGLDAVERAVVWVPPVLGALTVVALYRIARPLIGEAAARTAGVLLCVLSAHTWYSQIGFVDHHAAVSLLGALLLGAVLHCIRAVGGGSAADSAPWRPALVIGTLCAAILLVWPGSVVHVIAAQVSLLLFTMSRPRQDSAARMALALCGSHVLACALTLPGSTTHWQVWGAYSPVVLSRFQPWLFCALGVHAGACAALWLRGYGRTRRRRIAQSIGLGAATLGASALLVPDLLDGVSDAWRWLSKGEAFQRAVAESKSLFVLREGYDVWMAELRLSRFIYLFPPALALFAFEARRAANRPERWILAGWALLFAVLTVMQRRFFNSFSVLLAVIMAWSVLRAHAALPSHWRERAVLRFAGIAGITSVVVLLLWPMQSAYRLAVSNHTRALRGEMILLSPTTVAKVALVAGAHWLREHSPPTAGFLDTRLRPEYGVLADWDRGHVIKYVARRPTVVDNFGDDVAPRNLQLALRYFSSDESDAFALLQELDVRYVFVKPIDPTDRRGHAGSMRELLSADDPTGLEHHRLLYESPRSPHETRSAVRIFERVPGALVTGKAVPGRAVRARLPFISRGQRTQSVRLETTADAVGEYRLRLPYATRNGITALRIRGHWRIESAGALRELEISDEETRTGAHVVGPDFPMPSG